MTIFEMFEREDIYSILETTMHDYYRDICGKEIDVVVSKYHFGKRLLIYPRLGIVVSRCPSWAVIRRTYVSFDVQGNLPKKLFAWCYITLCFLTFGLFADASLILSDYSVFSKSTVIIPSNRKIRIYRYDEGYVDSILKNGFSDFYFKNEVKIRTSSQYDFILGVLDTSDRWYREALLKGRCLVRVPTVLYDSYMSRVLDDLSLLHSTETKNVSAGKYVLDLGQSCLTKLYDVVDKKHIKCGDKIIYIINSILSNYCGSLEIVPLTLTHGDLQTGNIYLDETNDKLYIIDWETACIKSVWYDAATVLCNTRRKGKFSSMINSRDTELTRMSILHFDDNKARDMNLVSAVLVFEELLFFLDEILDLPGEMGSEIIERFEYEVDNINWSSIY